MDQFIVDASVAAKWYFDEEMKEQACQLIEKLKRKEIHILVPGVFYSEVANICWKRVKKRILQIEDAVDTLDDMLELPLESFADQELADIALGHAIHFDISVYDGLYLALAEVYLAPFVTADENLLRKCRNRFEFIESLRDLKLK